jgi:uncharacterized protein with NRDE domain
MCTVSWIHTSSGYQLLCNRDERHARKAALAPVIHKAPGGRFIAPTDGDHGGSWIAVNESGIAFSLVNRYRCFHCSGEKKPKPPSRGLLVTWLADCRSLEEAQGRFDRLDLAAYPPFTIVGLARGRPSLLLHWTGRDSLIEWNGESAMPLTSSSFDDRGVEVYRKRLFQSLVAGRESADVKHLMDFHASHSPAPSAYSPCMHRDNAETVSFSKVTVRDDVIEFLYYPVSPCVRKDSDTNRPAWKFLQMRIIHPNYDRPRNTSSVERQPLSIMGAKL